MGARSYVLHSNWQLYSGAQPRPGVFQNQFPTMRLRHQAAQVQAQPYAACAALAGGIQPEKRLA